ncbi:hypothetical protein [Actinoplanes derwentensis]|uniref:Uncharacterized protein n=1 Tax=Actinoplanes derwentensis TaxID=113562 RepID=A0A1H1TFP9_9ACTN|nr:hypothetical protein [Actinoplanes derwentensis]GID85016.1 hypothetical protein Ade03nite_39400 [Actinoplanes derwentensis]SDS58974.1 hypothetical protein SAMN04489716_1125 [Actinoplanes derwentensis]
MTTYDSSVSSLPKIMPASETADSVNGSPVTTARKRPVIASVAALGLAALAAGSVIGGRKLAEARKPRSRWQRLMDRVR